MEYIKRFWWVFMLIMIAVVALVVYLQREMGEQPQPPSNAASSTENMGSSSDAVPEVQGTSTAARFKYPEELPTTYITAVDWPPDIFLSEIGYQCTEASETTARSGRTEERTINGRQYCVTTKEEGAAGSVYTQYAYMTVKDGKTFTLTFSTRSVQCGNYDETERLACEEERATFSLDSLVDQMADTVQFESGS